MAVEQTDPGSQRETVGLTGSEGDWVVTETLDGRTPEELIEEIRAIIDRGLGSTKSREVIAASEVADLLLDLRLLLDASDDELEAAPNN